MKSKNYEINQSKGSTMSNEKTSSENLRATLNKALKEDGKPGDKAQDDVSLTDTDLDDVAGGLEASCGAMCGSFA